MIELTPQQQAFVESQIATGAYHEPAEVVHAGLELLRREAEQREFDETVADVERAMEQMRRGEFMSVKEAMDSIRKELGLSSSRVDSWSTVTRHSSR